MRNDEVITLKNYKRTRNQSRLGRRHPSAVFCMGRPVKEKCQNASAKSKFKSKSNIIIQTKFGEDGMRNGRVIEQNVPFSSVIGDNVIMT